MIDLRSFSFDCRLIETHKRWIMNPSALAIMVLAACSSMGSATTLLFEDNFDAGTTGWFSGGSDGNMSNPSGTLSWNPTTAGVSSVIARQFTPTSLAVGETLRLSFSWTPQNETSGITRAGLLNLTNTISGNGWDATSGNGGIGGTASGYFSFFRDNDGGNGWGARYESGGVPGAADLQDGTSIGSGTTQFNFISGTVYTVVFDVTLVSLSEVQTLLTVGSGGSTHMSVAGTHTGAGVVSSFNTVGVRLHENSTSRLDDVRLEVIPELSSALLAAFGPISMAFRRRRS